jgi:hypothetical protein
MLTKVMRPEEIFNGTIGDDDRRVVGENPSSFYFINATVQLAPEFILSLIFLYPV